MTPSLAAQIHERFGDRPWATRRFGRDAQEMGALMACASILGGSEGTPSPESVALASLWASVASPAYSAGLVAAVLTLERLGAHLPERGFPGVVGAFHRSPSLASHAVGEARACWMHVCQTELPELGALLRVHDLTARKRAAEALRTLIDDEADADSLLEDLVGYDVRYGGTPSVAGFVQGIAWRSFLAFGPDDVIAAAREETRLLFALESYAVQQTDGGMPRDPRPWPLDFRCVCGQSLDPYLFCCDPLHAIPRGEHLSRLDPRMLVGPCETCGAFVPGFVCDACSTPHCWSLGIVRSLRDS